MKTNNRKNRKIHDNRGTTLVEMVVCFALMGIFVSAAAVVITSVTNLYYQIKGETYSNQVCDIVMEKIATELEGAKCTVDEDYPVIEKSKPGSTDNKITLYDRTDTLVSLYRANNQFVIEYAAISRPGYVRNATIWKFDEAVYNQYTIDALNFVPGDELINAAQYGVDLGEYGLDISSHQYKKNVVVVFMTVSSAKYGTYHMVRPVKMYYIPENMPSNP